MEGTKIGVKHRLLAIISLLALACTLSLVTLATPSVAWADEFNYDTDGDGVSDAWNISADETAAGYTSASAAQEAGADVVYAYVTENGKTTITVEGEDDSETEQEVTAYKLTISGSGDMADYVRYNDDEGSPAPWYADYAASINELVVESGITYIGSYAFSYCTALGDVSLAEGVAEIGAAAFEYTDSLTSIQLPASVTSFGNNPFQYCENLESITLAEGSSFQINNAALLTADSAGLIAYPAAAQKDVSGATYTIPDSVTTIWHAAFSYAQLDTVDIPNSVTTIESWAFARSSITSLTVPGTVTSMGDYAIGRCYSLKTVVFNEGITKLGNYVCREDAVLENVTLPSTVTSIGTQAFYDCEVLTSISLPSSLTSIGAQAFKYCSSLAEITIPSGVTSIGEQAFNECPSLTKVDLTNVSSDITFGWNSFNVDTEKCTIYVSSSTIANKLTAANTPSAAINNVNAFAVNGISYEIVDGAAAVAGVTSDFDGDLAIPESVTNSLGESYQVTSINCSFASNSSIVSVRLPSTITSISSGIFRSCTNLETVVINGLESIPTNAFYGCSSLTTVTLSNNLNTINSQAFQNCTSLVNVELPSSLETIGQMVFKGCSSLTYVSIPGSVDTIDQQAFMNCSSLKTVDMTERSSSTSFAVRWNAFVGIAQDCTIYVSNQSMYNYISNRIDGNYFASTVTVTLLSGNAYVTDGSTVTGYSTIAAAIAAVTDGQTITLNSDTTESVDFNTGKTLTFDLNGHTLTGADNDDAITVSAGAVTIVDNTGGGSVVSADTSTYYAAESTGSDAKLYIQGGKFTGQLGETNSGTIEVSGGTFSVQVASAYLADGYASTTADSDGYYSIAQGKLTAWGAGLRIDKYSNGDGIFDTSAADIRFGFGWEAPEGATNITIGWTYSGAKNGAISGTPYQADATELATKEDGVTYINYRAADQETYAYDKETGCNVSNLVMTSIGSDDFNTANTVQMTMTYTLDGVEYTIISDSVTRSVYSIAGSAYSNSNQDQTAYEYVKALLTAGGRLDNDGSLNSLYY